MMATPTKPTPSKAPEDLAFQPLVYGRDGTPRRTLPADVYEKRRELSTRFFMNQLNVSKRGNSSPSRGAPASTDLPGFSAKFAVLALAVFIPMAVFLPSLFSGAWLQSSPATEGPVTWSTIFAAPSKEDWSYGCHVSNITQDKNTSTVMFKVKFSDLPQDAFQSEQLQGSLPTVLWEQVNELGNYAFNGSSLSLQMPKEQPTFAVNATLDGSQKITVFLAKLTSGTLAQRLAQNEKFRGAMIGAGFSPKARTVPDSIKGKWLEPMVENAAKTQEDAAQGLLGYMYKVQQSYDAVKEMLHETESREFNLTREVQNKASELQVAELKLGQLEKDLSKTVKELGVASSNEKVLKKWKADAQVEITKLQNEVSTKDQSLQQKEKAYDKLSADYTALKSQLQTLQETLDGQTKNKTELQELRKQITSDKEALQKERDAVVSQLFKVLEERFNDTSLKGTAPSPSKLVKSIEQNLIKLSKNSTVEIKQLQAELAKKNKELTATLDKHNFEKLAAEKSFNTTLEQKDKESAAKLKDLESRKDQTIQDATKAAKLELSEMTKKLLAAEKKISNLESKVTDADKKIEDKTAQIRELQSKLSVTEKQLKAAEDQLTKSVADKEDVIKQKSSFEGEMKTLQAKHAEASEKLASQEARLAEIAKLLEKVMMWIGTGNDMKQEWQKLQAAAKGSS